MMMMNILGSKRKIHVKVRLKLRLASKVSISKDSQTYKKSSI